MVGSWAKICAVPTRRAAAVALAAAAAMLLSLHTPAYAAEPIKVGFSMAMTGGVAQNGKQLLIALQLWRDDVNAKGGLLGRPVELVYYDDQSNPSNVPGIYTKLINVDKVDLILGPYATNMVAAAMPVIMENNKTTVTILGVGVNRHFNYARYFSMVPVGPEGVKAFSKGFFELAAAQQPKPQTVAMLSADGSLPRPRPMARAKTPPLTASRSSTTKAIRRPRLILRRPCAPSRLPTRMWSSLPPIRRILSASCAPLTRSA